MYGFDKRHNVLGHNNLDLYKSSSTGMIYLPQIKQLDTLYNKLCIQVASQIVNLGSYEIREI